MIVVASLVFLFEALSIVFCLHYLYGEKPRFELITLGYVIFDVVWMDIVHFEYTQGGAQNG